MRSMVEGYPGRIGGSRKGDIPPGLTARAAAPAAQKLSLPRNLCIYIPYIRRPL